MLIRRMQIQDAEEVAQIHIESINTGFIRSLGLNFVRILYQEISKSKLSLGYVAEKNSEVVGFIASVVDMGDFYRYFLKNNFFKVAFLLLPKLFNITVLKKILEILEYPKRDLKVPLPEAELLSMAVKEDYQGKGIGQRLFNKLVDEFHKMEINEFRIIVGSSLFKAKNFYQRMGCKKVGEFELHKGERSEIYVFKQEVDR